MIDFPKNLALAGALVFSILMGACTSSGLTDDLRAGGPTRPGQAVPGSPEEFAAVVGDRIFFDSDSAELTAQSIATLDKQASWLIRYSQYQITLEGHADERGTREYNFGLGARRSEAARDYLISKGVPAWRIRSISYGKERPVAVCNDISCWSQNRRAVTVLGGGATS